MVLMGNGLVRLVRLEFTGLGCSKTWRGVLFVFASFEALGLGLGLGLSMCRVRELTPLSQANRPYPSRPLRP